MGPIYEKLTEVPQTARDRAQNLLDGQFTLLARGQSMDWRGSWLPPLETSSPKPTRPREPEESPRAARRRYLIKKPTLLVRVDSPDQKIPPQPLAPTAADGRVRRDFIRRRPSFMPADGAIRFERRGAILSSKLKPLVVTTEAGIDRRRASDLDELLEQMINKSLLAPLAAPAATAAVATKPHEIRKYVDTRYPMDPSHIS